MSWRYGFLGCGLIVLLSQAGGCGSSSGHAGGADSGTSGSGGSNGGGGGSGGGAGTGGGGSGGTAGGVDSGPPEPGQLVDSSRVTTWNPGILSDVPLGLPLGTNGLPQRTKDCASVALGGNIQAAINACPAGQVVQLAAGIYTVSATINLTSGVVLRGAGSQGAPGGTTIVRTGGGSVLSIGTSQDKPCYGGTTYPLTAMGAKESTTVSVAVSSVGNFKAGQIALIDIVDDSTVQEGDCSYFKRVDKRSVSQRVLIKSVDASTGTLTLDSPLHWAFPSASPYLADITPVTDATTEWAGIEHLRIQGGTNPGYDGQMAGGIDISNAAYSWVDDVQTDGTIGGMHVSMTGTYRCVVRDSYFHNSANYGFGTDCYGVVMRCGAAEDLVENNIVRYMNKPILFNVSGGGNVVGYNYADNSWATPDTWEEINIDCHCSFPHMELMEGNYAPHMGAGNTHGNAGYLTYYRNYASSQFAEPDPIWGSTAALNNNVTTLEFDTPDIGMNVLGNVLGTTGVSMTYDSYEFSAGAIYELAISGNGFTGTGATDISVTSLYRHGNYDSVNKAIEWDPSTTDHTLVASFYLHGTPAWWPSGTAWPWVGPDLTPMVGTLPAKTRSDAEPAISP
jgi:hypothetical protein